MVDWTQLALFLGAAVLLAVTPGPGLFYVAARSLAGGRADGIASSLGTALGGCVHIAAGALGISALLLASAEAFAVLKLAGAAYLIWLGIRTIRSANAPPAAAVTGRAFRQGFAVEALNPKTAAFFLAFIPQFVDPERGQVAVQFAILGLVSVGLNTAADIAVAFWAAALSRRAGPGLVRRLRQGSGVLMCGLGAALAVGRRPG